MKNEVINALGRNKQSDELQNLISIINDDFIYEQSPESKKYYLNFYQQGIYLLFDEKNMLSSVCFYITPNEDFREYLGNIDILSGVIKSDSPTIVITKLGEPNIHKFPSIAAYNFQIPEWLRYDMEKYSFHIEFNKDKLGISRINYIRSDAVPS